MKNTRSLLVLALTLATSQVWAQESKVEIAPFYGYQFGGSYNVIEGKLSIPASGNWGFTINVRVTDDGMIEFLYSRQDSRLQFQPGGLGPKEDVFDLAAEYYQGGGLLEFGDGPAKPYIALGVGALRLNPKPDELDSEWSFSANFAGGIKVLPGHIGFRAEFRLLVPFYGGGFSIGCGLPGVCTGVSGFAATAQGNVNAGLIIAF